MTYLLSLSVNEYGRVVGGGRGCHYCMSSTGDCLHHRCTDPRYEWYEGKRIGWKHCYCSVDECNCSGDECNCSGHECNADFETTTESNSSIQMQYFWPNLMLSFVIYLMFMY